MKGTGGEKAKERDGMDCSTPMLAFYPPATHTRGTRMPTHLFICC